MKEPKMLVPGQNPEKELNWHKSPEKNEKPHTIDASSLYNKVGFSYVNGLSFESSTGKTEFIPWNEVFGAVAGGSYMGEQLIAKHKEKIIKTAEDMRDIANEVISVCEKAKAKEEK